ncbi:MAG: MFS transporter, partial [Bilophila wadsworthia]
SMPFTGLISGRFGCRKVILVSGFIFLAMLPLLASVESIWLMALCLFLFGASIGMMDVSLTIQAVFVEQAAGRAMMSGFHCLYSVGGICGAGGMALLLGFLAPHLAMLVICLFMIALLAAFGRHFLPYGSEGETPLFVVPRGIVLLIGVLCFIMYLSEGTILDWGALFMTAERGTEASRAGLAFACFSVAMTIGRLFGDRIVQALGDARVLLYGSPCAAAGFGLWSPRRGHGLRSPGLRSVSAFRTSCPCFSRLRPARSSCP